MKTQTGRKLNTNIIDLNVMDHLGLIKVYRTH
jgi:hypothetical protein